MSEGVCCMKLQHRLSVASAVFVVNTDILLTWKYVRPGVSDLLLSLGDAVVRFWYY